MQYKDWDGNLLPDPAPRIHNVHIGDVIKIKENEENPGRWGKPFREYEIIEIYPRIVLTRDKKTGFRRSFSYGDLLTMGLENQDSVEDCRPSPYTALLSPSWTAAASWYQRPPRGYVYSYREYTPKGLLV